MPEPTPFREFALAALATACRLDRSAIDDRTSMLDMNMDSLTLVSVLSRIEAVYGVDFAAADTVDFLQGRDVGELIGAIERVLAQRDNER